MTMSDHKCCIQETTFCRHSCDNTFFICLGTNCEFGNIKVNDIALEDDEKFKTGKNETRLKNPFPVNLPLGFNKVSLLLVFESGKKAKRNLHMKKIFPLLK